MTSMPPKPLRPMTSSSLVEEGDGRRTISRLTRVGRVAEAEARIAVMVDAA